MAFVRRMHDTPDCVDSRCKGVDRSSTSPFSDSLRFVDAMTTLTSLHDWFHGIVKVIVGYY